MEQSKGFRGYRVVAKTQESAVITSFGLQPVEQGAAAVFIPGQFLTLRLADHEGVSVIRNYSLSGDPGNHSQGLIGRQTLQALLPLDDYRGAILPRRSGRGRIARTA
ncbi:hypothetical protein NJC40_16465 [Pseudomonas sp. 21LCFQ02]|uniref:hypothetical protein n=1 Tax=Pseudomonas sp. 21LCFQ02 TaxID=2957505 RepID=UPI00209BAE87|nr:hypothetical protein [Pseudomonas sp. 21LCFQ02]MCO8169358.1 hypothetical protein [Pseudomonas sp. 21LCFQ02]